MYAITFKESARKELYALPNKELTRVAQAIEKLAETPRPPGVKKLKAQNSSLWRIRVGDYRVIYSIEDSIRIVDIRRVGHRREVYD